jgi:hypothetical protein
MTAAENGSTRNAGGSADGCAAAVGCGGDAQPVMPSKLPKPAPIQARRPAIGPLPFDPLFDPLPMTDPVSPSAAKSGMVAAGTAVLRQRWATQRPVTSTPLKRRRDHAQRSSLLFERIQTLRSEDWLHSLRYSCSGKQ